MDLRDSLAQIVGSAHMLVDPDTTAAFTSDWTGRFHGDAYAVVRPANVDEVAAVVAALRRGRPANPTAGWQHRIGGRECSLPPPDERDSDRRPVVVSMTRLSEIGDVDTRGTVDGRGGSHARRCSGGSVGGRLVLRRGHCVT